MRRPDSRRYVVGWRGLLVAGLLLAVVAGCGKKGPPVAPDLPPLPRITELKGSLAGDTATLVWRCVGRENTRAFNVLRAQSPADQPACPKCPMIFQMVGTADPGRDADHCQFSESVAAGFVYTYKVQPVGPAGDQGAESNLVIIDRSAHEAER